MNVSFKKLLFILLLLSAAGIDVTKGAQKLLRQFGSKLASNNNLARRTFSSGKNKGGRKKNVPQMKNNKTKTPARPSSKPVKVKIAKPIDPPFKEMNHQVAEDYVRGVFESVGKQLKASRKEFPVNTKTLPSHEKSILKQIFPEASSKKTSSNPFDQDILNYRLNLPHTEDELEIIHVSTDNSAPEAFYKWWFEYAKYSNGSCYGQRHAHTSRVHTESQSSLLQPDNSCLYLINGPIYDHNRNLLNLRELKAIEEELLLPFLTQKEYNVIYPKNHVGLYKEGVFWALQQRKLRLLQRVPLFDKLGEKLNADAKEALGKKYGLPGIRKDEFDKILNAAFDNVSQIVQDLKYKRRRDEWFSIPPDPVVGRPRPTFHRWR